MDTVKTKYGNLQGIESIEYYCSGSIKECKLSAFNEINTPVGIFTPQFEDDGVRRKHINSLSFYESGNIKSIALHLQKEIQTTIGLIPAEKIIFYESGAIKRIFPLNGKITGFWTEENEYDLAKEIHIKVPFGFVKKKIIGIYFYEGGAIKSLTLWPEDSLSIATPIGTIDTQIGIAFYEDGQIKSMEPKSSTIVDTPIGNIAAYNTSILGLHGDTNSLCFLKEGKLKSLLTPTDHITITDVKGNRYIKKPGLKQNLFNDNVMDRVPLSIEFKDNKVRFNQSEMEEYLIEKHTFTVKHFPINAQGQCSSCTGCNAC